MVTPTSLMDLGQELEVAPMRTCISVEEATSYIIHSVHNDPLTPVHYYMTGSDKKLEDQRSARILDCCTGYSVILVQSDRFIFAVICLRAYNIEV